MNQHSYGPAMKVFTWSSNLTLNGMNIWTKILYDLKGCKRQGLQIKVPKCCHGIFFNQKCIVSKEICVRLIWTNFANNLLFLQKIDALAFLQSITCALSNTNENETCTWSHSVIGTTSSITLFLIWQVTLCTWNADTIKDTHVCHTNIHCAKMQLSTR